jgi:hypothetical protein
MTRLLMSGLSIATALFVCATLIAAGPGAGAQFFENQTCSSKPMFAFIPQSLLSAPLPT